MSVIKEMPLEQKLRAKIDNKTKPLGSLGQLEDLALQIGLVQQTLTPKLVNPYILVFAGDHGITKEGVSAYPQEVTYQMVYNFLSGGAAINVLARQHGIALTVIDAGVNHDFRSVDGLVDAKVGWGTRNFAKETAMAVEELEKAISHGAEQVNKIAGLGCNIVGFGEMGIGNTSAASLIMSKLCDLPIEDCVGRGTGLDDDQIVRKIKALQASSDFHGSSNNPKEIMRTYGGFEMAQMCGAMISAYERKMLILVDGFIATASFLVACKINPDIISNAIFCHQSEENGHSKMLEYMSARPLLNLNMRLGEGSGCAVAYPIVQSAVNFLNEMASFDDAGVSKES